MNDGPDEPATFTARLKTIAADPRQWPKALLTLLRLLYRPVRTGFLKARARGSYLRGRLRRRTDFVEERWPGSQDLEAAVRVAVFSHYDPQGVLHGFAAHYVRELSEAGFAVIFVSNSPRLPDDTVAELRPRCALILRRANIGYDFGALKDGIARIPRLDRLGALLLANDSVYGPFRPLGDVVAAMDGSADVWGATDCWEQGYHLQSFFLLFGPAALRSPAFARFWSQVAYVQSKDWIIGQYEIGLTRALQADGLRCRALFPYRPAAAALRQAVERDGLLREARLDPAVKGYVRLLYDLVRRDAPLNGTHYFWDYLIERQGCPFLKRELLRDNPMRIPFIRHWERVVRSAGGYDTDLIARHLRESLRGGPVPDPAPPGPPPRPWYGPPTPSRVDHG